MPGAHFLDGGAIQGLCDRRSRQQATQSRVGATRLQSQNFLHSSGCARHVGMRMTVSKGPRKVLFSSAGCDVQLFVDDHPISVSETGFRIIAGPPSWHRPAVVDAAGKPS